MEENEKECKSIIKKLLIIIVVLSTYIMAFMLGKITNKATLSGKDVINDNVQSGEPTTKPTNNPNTDNNGKVPDNITTPSKEPNNEPTALPSTPPSTGSTALPSTPPSTDPSNPDTTVPNEIITLWEGNKKWSQLEELSIFKNTFYQKEASNKIAPGFYGTYEFVLENNGDMDVKYVFGFKEGNKENINMVYKVTCDGKYVLGNDEQYVYIDNVKLDSVIIPAKSKHTFKLNWKWEDTENDTHIGQMNNVQYKLKIILDAEAIY